MKNTLIISLLALIFLKPQAEASLFNYSYTNSNDTIITGVLDGVLQTDNNLVFVSSMLDFVSINSIPGPSLSTVDSFSNYFLGSGGLPAIVSLDGSLMDFIAVDSTGSEAFSFDSVGYLSAGIPQYMSTVAFDDIPAEAYNQANWQLTPIPEPPTLPLIAFCVLSALAWQLRVSESVRLSKK